MAASKKSNLFIDQSQNPSMVSLKEPSENIFIQSSQEIPKTKKPLTWTEGLGS